MTRESFQQLKYKPNSSMASLTELRQSISWRASTSGTDSWGSWSATPMRRALVSPVRRYSPLVSARQKACYPTNARTLNFGDIYMMVHFWQRKVSHPLQISSVSRDRWGTQFVSGQKICLALTSNSRTKVVEEYLHCPKLKEYIIKSSNGKLASLLF